MKKLEIEYQKPDSPPSLLAQELSGKIPIIYADSPRLFPIALRWKNDLNENSKVLAFCNFFPELNHNEIEGWNDKNKGLDNFYVLILREKEQSARLKIQMEFAQTIIRKFTRIREIYPRGKSKLCEMFSLVYLGSLLSLELAKIRGVNPEIIAQIRELKTELSSREALK